MGFRYTPPAIIRIDYFRIQKCPFPTSPWTQIAHLSDGQDREGVLRDCCTLYSGPIYAFVSHKYPDLDPQDLTQEIFAYVFSKDFLKRADREGGKLRTYLMHIIKGVASKSWRSQNEP